jgi:integral membrane protein (TIGR01906 family)
MERAPWAAGLLFGLSLAIVVTIAGPLLLFNPPFVWALQDRHHVAEVGFDGRHDAVDAVTLSTLVDIWTDGSFAAELQPGEPLLNERERSHMHDVAVLVRILLGVLVMALVIGGVALAWLRREPGRIGRIMLVVGGVIGGMAIVLAGIFAVAFEPAFLVFHELFFPPGTYLFEPGSKLITLFPEGFWFDAALAAGATIVIAAVLVTLIGFRLWRREAPPASA